MGILDGGLQSVFGAAFGGLYLFGFLHRATRSADNDEGDFTVTYRQEDIKVQMDRLTYSQRQVAGDKIAAGSVRLLVLQTIDGRVVTKPTTDDQITAGGLRFALSEIGADPANSYWDMIGSPV